MLSATSASYPAPCIASVVAQIPILEIADLEDVVLASEGGRDEGWMVVLAMN